MNALELMESQHEDIEELFYELGVARDVATRARILGELATGLVAHDACERQLLSALRAKGLDAAVLESWTEQLDAEGVVSALLAVDLADATFEAKLAALQDRFETSVEHEELLLFPRLRALLERGTSVPVRQEAPVRMAARSPEGPGVARAA